MRKYFKITLKLMLILIPAIGIATSCAEESDCSLVNRASVNGYFYTHNENGVVVRGAYPLLTITALGTDSVILNSEPNAEIINLPLQYTQDTTAIVFRYSELSADTIVFRHTNTPYFLSMECGYDMKQVVTDFYYTTHGVDSIFLTERNTNKDGTENLQIFYTPDVAD